MSFQDSKNTQSTQVPVTQDELDTYTMSQYDHGTITQTGMTCQKILL